MSSDFNASQYATTNASCSSSRWLTEEVFKLIDIVQRDEAIYNPRHKYYFCRPYVENFWREVDLKLEKNPGASLAKWTNLRISFRREYTNYLEEKVPPCWSYFDRMFFLHPYLRKKHQQPKSLDTEVQHALAHLSSLSNRMQRERAAAACTTASTTQPNTSSAVNSAQQSPQPQQLDNYLDYFDEHEHNNSELDDIIDEEQRSRFQNPLDNNDIKSECEEPVDDYEPEHHSSAQHMHQHDDDEHEEQEMHKIVYDSLSTTVAPSSSVSAASSTVEKRYTQHASHSRLQHYNRLQMRAYHEEVRAMRPRSQDLPSVSSGGAAGAAVATTAVNTTQQTHSNISFVRPTFTKPVDMVSTTTHSSNNSAANSNAAAEVELPSSATAAICAAPTTSNSYLAQRHSVHHQAAQRLEGNNSSLNTGAVGPLGGAAEMCDCKSDPDAMFLMSLLPDIQKLNGRDRGKIKIAFQNILQDYLYPD